MNHVRQFKIEKRCPACNSIKPFTEFRICSSTHDLLSSYCRECAKRKSNEYHRSDIGRERKRAFRQSEKGKASARREVRRRVLSKFALTQERYDSMLMSQDNRCAICKTNDPSMGRYRKKFLDRPRPSKREYSWAFVQ